MNLLHPSAIVVEIRGGSCVRVFDEKTGKSIYCQLIDWDSIRAGDRIPRVARQ
jgi:hypothetical protein